MWHSLPHIPQSTFIVMLQCRSWRNLFFKLKDNKYYLFQKLGNFIYNSSQSHATYFNEYNTKLAQKKHICIFLFSSKCWLNIQKYSLQILYRKYSAAEFLLIQTCLRDSQTLAVLKQTVGKGRGLYVYICEVTMVRGGAILDHHRMKQNSGVGKEEVPWWFTMACHNEGLINWQFSFNNHVSKKYIKKK